VRRSGPPTDWPIDSATSSSDPAPAKASAPRRDIVGAAGAGLTRDPASAGSGRVCAVSVRSSRISLRLRSALITVGAFRHVCTTKAATNTQAP